MNIKHLNYDSGEFKFGKREGKGVFTWHDGERYEGGFKNDKRDGFGTYYYANKVIFDTTELISWETFE